MTYEDLVRVAVETGTDGLDMTVYWLPSTTDDYLLSLRRLAYRNRVEIYSIGTRVQLANPAGPLRDKQFAELKQWVDVASKLGASHIRVAERTSPTPSRAGLRTGDGSCSIASSMATPTPWSPTSTRSTSEPAV